MTPDPAQDLAILQRVALSPASGDLATRAALIRCARVLAGVLGAAGVTLAPAPRDPYADAPPPERQPPPPIE